MILIYAAENLAVTALINKKLLLWKRLKCIIVSNIF